MLSTRLCVFFCKQRSHTVNFTFALKSLYSSSRNFSQTSPDLGLNGMHLQEDAESIFLAGVQAVSPNDMVRNALHFDKNSKVFQVGGCTFPVDRNISILGVGKAAAGMVRAVEDILGDHVKRGLVIIPSGLQDDLRSRGHRHLLSSSSSKVQVLEGAKNNMPDEDSLDASKQAQALLSELTEEDILLTLVTGGGSALLSLPVPPISLSDLLSLTKALSMSGASIEELNVLRKNVEILKGGGVWQLAHPAKTVSLILSDIIGNPIDLIASGPTSPPTESTGPLQALRVLAKYSLTDKVPASVVAVLGEATKTGHLRSLSPSLCSAESAPLPTNVLVGTNTIAVKAAQEQAHELGYSTHVLTSALSGEAKVIGTDFAHLARNILSYISGGSNAVGSARSSLIKSTEDQLQLQRFLDSANQSSLCILSAGEPTVTVSGSGLGGRNQEMALATALSLAVQTGVEGHTESFLRNIHFASAGTDGQDGPTSAAGAHANVAVGRATGVNGKRGELYLKENDSHTFYRSIENGRYLINTGLTGTNVMDIQTLLIHREQCG